jgi:hypothetical protein
VNKIIDLKTKRAEKQARLQEEFMEGHLCARLIVSEDASVQGSTAPTPRTREGKWAGGQQFEYLSGFGGAYGGRKEDADSAHGS